MLANRFIFLICSVVYLSTSEITTNPPRNCKEVKNQGHTVSDVYLIYPEFSPKPFLVVCDLKSNAGGWTYILNRYDGSQDFYKDWKDYKYGFGNLAGEFWLGLEHIHHLTGYETNELLVELVDWNFRKVFARYDSFGIGDESEGYSLKLLGGFNGDAGDSLTYHAGMKFGTRDKDYDTWNADFCARNSTGAWWYRSCLESQLTGSYLEKNFNKSTPYRGIFWKSFHDGQYSLREARMKIRPRDHSRPVTLPQTDNFN